MSIRTNRIVPLALSATLALGLAACADDGGDATDDPAVEDTGTEMDDAGTETEMDAGTETEADG